MTLEELYKKVVEIGKKADPRSAADIKRFMKSRTEAYKKLKTTAEKELFRDRLWNPYDDTRIIFGEHKRKVGVVFVGIDIGTEDLVLISQLNELRVSKGKKPIDLAMAHHPEGYALGGLAGVMDDIQVEVLRQAGVPVNITEKILASRVRDVEISVHGDNLHHTMDSARLLDIPLICCHTVADNNAFQTITRIIEKAMPHTLQEVVDALMKIPAYEKASHHFERPVDIQVGSPNSRAGKIIVGGFTGGTEGNPDILEFAVNVAGVGTTIDMHMSRKHRELSEKHRLNTVVANHMASDSIGMQPIVDMMRKAGIEVIVGSGYIDAPLP
ncbi:MAG: NGG1p interacting factor NIF3 [Candidatus Gracilibacteria bacterium]|nr:NGG1p interacting factor NIF3 [bacterium]MDZ4217371.1 NGG1p interacting factor NIF3 [Candidatus Gracilibacteria bacterium]